jgi:hypothetical protein
MGISRVHELARQPAEPRAVSRHSLRPRLVALAACTADVVQVAGGWLCDQVLAGWDVTVVTADHADQRALRILGVRGHDLESALASPVRRACLQAIVVQSELYQADERVREMVRAAAETGRTEIRLWGGCRPAAFENRADLVSHRLSAAARAFKAQALAAAAVGAEPADTEEFRRAALRRPALV